MAQLKNALRSGSASQKATVKKVRSECGSIPDPGPLKHRGLCGSIPEPGPMVRKPIQRKS